MKYLVILCILTATKLILASPLRHEQNVKPLVSGNSWVVSGSAISSLTSTEGRCSFIHVGPSTALTAAHCLQKNNKIVNTLNFSGLEGSSNTSIGKNFFATCTKHPKYSSNDVITSYDYAICKLSRNIGSGSLKFETLKTDLEGITENSILYIGGYGCQKTAEDPFNNKFRIGKVKVISLPKGDVSHIGTTNKLGNGKKGALLCPGDSGGPTFYNPNGGSNRKVVGINSTVISECIYGNNAINPVTKTKGCSCSKEKPKEFCEYRWKPIDNSYISSLSTTIFKSFLAKWVKDNTIEDGKKVPQICGYNFWDTKKCRSVSSGGGLEG